MCDGASEQLYKIIIKSTLFSYVMTKEVATSMLNFISLYTLFLQIFF